MQAAPARSSSSLRADISKGLATAKQLPEFRAQVADLEARLDNLQAVLPDEKDAADLLRRMQTVATQSNLTIKSFKPAPTVTKQLHAEWPIALQLDGTYHNLAIFFDRVGKFTRIVNITGARREGQGQAGAELHDHRQLPWRRRSCCSTSRRSGQGGREEARGACAARRRAPDHEGVPDRVAVRRRSRRQAAFAQAAPASRRPRRQRAAAKSAPAVPADVRLKSPDEGYTYQPDGRRDPFLSLLGTGAEAGRDVAEGRRPARAHGRRDLGARRFCRAGGELDRDGAGAGQEDLHRARRRQAPRRHD